MTSNEFILWLKGFVQATNPYDITPKQWDNIKTQLDKVNKPNTGGYTISIKDGTYGTTNSTARIDTTYKTDELTTNTVF